MNCSAAPNVVPYPLIIIQLVGNRKQLDYSPTGKRRCGPSDLGGMFEQALDGFGHRIDDCKFERPHKGSRH